jgi:hypothetical protein
MFQGLWGGAVDGIVALPIGEHQRDVGLAEEHHARLFETLDRERAGVGHVGFERWIAPRGGRASNVVALLDGHGHTMQRSPDLALSERRIGSLGALSRPLAVLPYDRVELRVESIDACQEMLEHLARADFLAADQMRNIGG